MQWNKNGWVNTAGGWVQPTANTTASTFTVLNVPQDQPRPVVQIDPEPNAEQVEHTIAQLLALRQKLQAV
jgi:hypothetical protein